jgi:polyisoprenyl-phosphate glycosyltransferase
MVGQAGVERVWECCRAVGVARLCSWGSEVRGTGAQGRSAAREEGVSITRQDLDVSIVLPVYNEVGHLRDEIDRIRSAMDASRYTYEILVVDDGSNDGSGDELRQIPGIRLMQFAENRGSGSARRAGTDAATGRIVVWTDVDMTYPNDRIPELVDQLDGADQIVGARTTEEGTVKFFRVPAKWFIRRLAEYLAGARIPDLNSGMRAFRRDVGQQFTHLLPAGFSCVTTITMAFLANGYSVRYTPISYSKRAGASKFHWWSDSTKYLQQVVRLCLTYNPLRVFGPLAIALLLVGSGKLVYDWIDKDLRLTPNTLLILFAGFQFFVLGLLADLIVRLARPQHQVTPALRHDEAVAIEAGTVEVPSVESAVVDQLQ